MTFVHQSGSGSEACLVWALFFPLCTNRRCSVTLADMASCVALGYQTIKEWDYNGERPREEGGKASEYRGEEVAMSEAREGCTVAEVTALFLSFSKTDSPSCPPPPGQGITQERVGGTAADAYTRLPRRPTTLSCFSATQAALSTPLLLLGWQLQRVHSAGCSWDAASSVVHAHTHTHPLLCQPDSHQQIVHLPPPAPRWPKPR